MVEFSPSILAADFSKLKEEIDKVKEASYLHLDIMDGMFVPNITFGPCLISAIRPHSSLKFDTHLMIEKPEKYIGEFAQAGSDLITFHVEATNHPDRVVNQIKENNCLAGAALTPSTPLSALEYILMDLDLVLLMTVNPGFGGQNFIPQMLDKIRKLRKMVEEMGLPTRIAIDGGVNRENVKKIAGAGVDIIIAGSAIFSQPDPAATLNEMQNLFRNNK